VSDAIFVDGDRIAIEAGSPKALNTVLLGVALAENLLPFGIEEVKTCIRTYLPAKHVDLNLKALALGYAYKG
jgi:indolepyruvate ferredoxin oxidoreductase beta subunit